jgi:hypothetical protein
MAKKPDITTIASGYYSRQALNTNFENLQDGFDNTLSLDGSTPNSMGADFDVNGNNILNAGQIATDSLLIGGVAVASGSGVNFETTYLTASYTGDGSTLAYALTANPQTENNVNIYVDGVYQNKTTFSLSGTTVTFSAAPPLNAAIEIVYPTNTDTLNGSDALAITYNQGGTNAQDRNVKQKLQETVSVKDFGAVGDGVTNDTAAVSAWLDNLLTTANKGYVPEGQYLLSSQVAKTTTNINLTIEGAGIGISQFLVGNGTGGISLVSTDKETEVYISGVEFIANQTNAGVGLQITMPEGGNRHNRSVVLRDVKFSVINETDATNYGYFSTAVDLTGCWRPLLNNLIVSGPYGPGISSNLSDSSPIYKTSVGVDVDGCYGVKIINSYIWSCSIGISNVSTIDPGPEGFRLSNTNIVEVKKAVIFTRVGREPTLLISDCHYNYRDRGLHINGAKLVIITNCVPYNVDTAPQFSGEPEDIYLNNAEKIIISGNMFHFNGNPNRKNIDLLSGDFLDNCLIEGNIFNSKAATAIDIRASATDVFIVNNEFPGTITTEVNDRSNAVTVLQRDGTGKMRLESLAQGATINPEYSFYRNSASPAAADSLGQLTFNGNDSAGNRTLFSAIKSVARIVTNGAEEGELEIYNAVGGSTTPVAVFDNASTSQDTSLFLLTNNGSSIALKRVTLGAADSGGTGHRMLRVLN